MTGKVKWFNAKKGYGFIVGEDGAEYFAHYSKITGEGFKYLEDGEEVSFESVETEKGLTAEKINRSNK